MPKKRDAKDFFDEMTEQSEVKVEIVRKYFRVWAKIIAKQVIKRGQSEIRYVDLFAGPGRYRDGSPSTPILILESALRDREVSQLLAAKFNDENPDNAQALDEEIKKIPGIDILKHAPVVRNFTVDDSLASRFERWTIPTLFFLDPWGYKGVSLELIKAVLKPWGCDCIFFFNYNRINQHLSNQKFTKNMAAFFGTDRADRLRASLQGKNPFERQELIIKELKHALQELGAQHTIEYYFKDESGRKTSHFLIFATKHPLAYDIMKQIMGTESTRDTQGVPSFGFNPLDSQDRQDSLFYRPIDDLGEELLQVFDGKTLTTEDIYRQHGLGKGFVFKNYQDALKKLEAQGKIQTDPPIQDRMRAGQVTFGKNVKVTFLPKKG
jgi:three-Cys-motif partner protein